MSKLILVLCLVALAMAEDGFNTKYTPEVSPDQPKITTEEASTMFNFIDSPIVDLVWCGNKREVIFMLTEKNTLYRSVDDGFSGHKVTEHLQRLGKQELAGSDANVGQVAKIIQHPNEKNMILLLGTETINWITEDCGAGFRAMDQGRPVEEFLFHPTERNWILAAAWTKCEDFPGEPCRRFKELFLSKNLGGDWELVANYVYQFSWGRVDNNFFRVPKERIIIAYDQAAKGHQNFKNWHDKIQITYSDDFFKTNTSVLPRSSKFLVTSYFIFAVQYNDEDSQEITLHVGDSRTRNYALRPIELPVKRLMEHSYTILDTAEHSVFLHINHDGEQSSFGNIYVSDSTGVRYSTSLGGNIINANGQCDFERVLGLEGIYLANVIDRDARKRFKNLDVNEFPQQQASKGKGGSGPKDTSLDKAKTALHDFKQTVISFNKGGIWQPLVPPERDVDGNRIKCVSEEECQLHLHSISNTNFGPFYTTENSLGLILGTGNIGKYLSNKADEINTYLSRDGGLTWFEIAKGSHIYEIGDHGSVIVIAPDQHATKELKYSWNEGLTWETLKISDVPIEVTNIIIEPTNTAEKFLVYGRESGQQKRGAVIAVDFTPIHQRECKGVENPDTPESDYETWSPNGKISPHCLLGKQVTYTRRKREAECFNKEDHDRWRYVNRCQCTEDDWECDYGYVRIGTGPCLPMDKKMEEMTRAAPPPSECDGSYSITQGYRKVGGNSCDGGINHDPIKIPCPMVITKETQNMIALLALSVVAVGLLWKGSNNGTVDRVKSYLGGFKNNFTSKLTRFKKDDDKDKGFQRLGGEPGSMADEENEFGRIEFEDNEDGNEIVYGDDAQDQQNVRKRMTERKAIETANKRVPTLNRPGEKKGSSGVNLLE